MKPKEDTRVDPPVTDPTTYVETKTFAGQIGSAADVARTPITIVKDGEVIKPGTQTAKTLALLGTDEETLDSAWAEFNRKAISDSLNEARVLPNAVDPTWVPTYEHHENMGWSVRVVIDAEGVTETDLIYIDPRSVHREVTFRAKKWDLRRAPISPDGYRRPSGYTTVAQTEPLDEAAAVSLLWHAVAEDEIESTKKCNAALVDAWKYLNEALKEISIAEKISREAWDGPRAQATRYKFGIEYEIVESVNEVLGRWGQYMNELIPAQKKAQEDHRELQKAIAAEIGFQLVNWVFLRGALGALTKLGKVAASAVRGEKAARAAKAVRTYEGRIATFKKALSASHSVKEAERALTKWKKFQKFVAATSAAGLREGTADLAATTGVEHLKGNVTLGDWWKSYVFAGLIGGSGGEAASMAKKFAKDHSFKFGAVKGAGQAGATAAGKGALTNDPLVGGLVTTPLVGAAKEKAVNGLARKLARETGLSFDDAKKKVEPYVDVLVAPVRAGSAKAIDESRKDDTSRNADAPPGLVPSTG